jgi:hypothetical protein
MNNDILNKTLPLPIKEKNGIFLGIPTGIKGRSFSVTKLSKSYSTNGWIVRGDKIEEWKVLGIVEHEGETFVYGDLLEGEPLEKLFDRSIEKTLFKFKELCSALEKITASGIEIQHITTNGIIFLDKGGIVFLPPLLMKEVINFFPQEEKCMASEAINHPDLKGEKKLSYTLGSIIYRLLANEYPVMITNEEDVRYQTRHKVKLPARFKNPEIKDEVSSFIASAIGQDQPAIPSLAAWIKTLDSWIEKSVFSPVPETKKKSIIAEGRAREGRDHKALSRKQFWEKNGARILVLTLVFAGVGFIFGSIINNFFFKPRATRGFTPLSVVKTFYDSINKLDVITMSDCVSGNAGKDDIDTVTNLYVMSKPANMYDSTPTFVSADKWDAKGRPQLAPGVTMFGVTGLHIVQEKPEPEPVFVAMYDKWYTEKDPKTAEWELSFDIHGVAIKERLFLKRDRKDWLIYKFERLEENVKTK